MTSIYTRRRRLSNRCGSYNWDTKWWEKIESASSTDMSQESDSCRWLTCPTALVDSFVSAFLRWPSVKSLSVSCFIGANIRRWLPPLVLVPPLSDLCQILVQHSPTPKALSHLETKLMKLTKSYDPPSGWSFICSWATMWVGWTASGNANDNSIYNWDHSLVTCATDWRCVSIVLAIVVPSDSGLVTSSCICFRCSL